MPGVRLLLDLLARHLGVNRDKRLEEEARVRAVDIGDGSHRSSCATALFDQDRPLHSQRCTLESSPVATDENCSTDQPDAQG